MNMDAGIYIISSYEHAHMQGNTSILSRAGVVEIVENSNKSLPLLELSVPECYQHSEAQIDQQWYTFI